MRQFYFSEIPLSGFNTPDYGADTIAELSDNNYNTRQTIILNTDGFLPSPAITAIPNWWWCLLGNVDTRETSPSYFRLDFDLFRGATHYQFGFGDTHADHLPGPGGPADFLEVLFKFEQTTSGTAPTRFRFNLNSSQGHFCEIRALNLQLPIDDKFMAFEKSTEQRDAITHKLLHRETITYPIPDRPKCSYRMQRRYVDESDYRELLSFSQEHPEFSAFLQYEESLFSGSQTLNSETFDFEVWAWRYPRVGADLRVVPCRFETSFESAYSIPWTEAGVDMDWSLIER